jgi:hypothetical protein
VYTSVEKTPRPFLQVFGKSFQIALHKLQKLDRFKDIKSFFAKRNDIAFIVFEA